MEAAFLIFVLLTGVASGLCAARVLRRPRSVLARAAIILAFQALVFAAACMGFEQISVRREIAEWRVKRLVTSERITRVGPLIRAYHLEYAPSPRSAELGISAGRIVELGWPACPPVLLLATLCSTPIAAGAWFLARRTAPTR